MTMLDRKRDEIKGYMARREAGIMLHYGPGAVTMALCPLCGATNHMSTQAEASPDSITFVPMSSVEECGRCAEVAARAPEIYKWILGCEMSRRVRAYEDLLEQEREVTLRAKHAPGLRQFVAGEHMKIDGCTCGYTCTTDDRDDELARHVALMRAAGGST